MYGTLEIVIGLLALLFPFVIAGLTELNVYIHRDLWPGASHYQMSAVKFVLYFVTVLVPASLMGATFPDHRQVLREETSGTRNGRKHHLHNQHAGRRDRLLGDGFCLDTNSRTDRDDLLDRGPEYRHWADRHRTWLANVKEPCLERSIVGRRTFFSRTDDRQAGCERRWYRSRAGNHETCGDRSTARLFRFGILRPGV